jgi:asparagine synthase (glutamine-hydrolysing)
VFLSAGIDSTTLAALASEAGGELETVTLGFSEYQGTAEDEVPLATRVAAQLKSKHHLVWVSRQDFEAEFPKLIRAMDQPSTDGINSYFVSKAAAQSGLKVAISGLGGDELFAGYPSFSEIPRSVRAFQPFQPFQPLNRGLRALSAPVLKRFTSPKYAGLLEYGGTYSGAYLLRRGMFMPWELPEILDADMVREGWSELQTVDRLQNTTHGLSADHTRVAALELSWYMRHQLLRDTDWASMAHSLEVRVPLVDTHLLSALSSQLAGSCPPTKRDLAAIPATVLPSEIVDRPKTGFTVPVREWLMGQNADRQPLGAKRRKAERGLRGWAKVVYQQFVGVEV